MADIGFNQLDGSPITSNDTYVRQCISRRLLTYRGYRIGRPDYGSGLIDLLGQLGSPETYASIQSLVIGAAEDLIAIDNIRTERLSDTGVRCIINGSFEIVLEAGS